MITKTRAVLFCGLKIIAVTLSSFSFDAHNILQSLLSHAYSTRTVAGHIVLQIHIHAAFLVACVPYRTEPMLVIG